MNHKRWIVLLGAAALTSCTPFTVAKPDGGDAKGSQAGASGSAGTTAPSQDGGVDAPTGGSANGIACTFDTDCRFGHCVEGVCCDGACAGACASCRGADTGAADGKCAPVNAGLAHGTDCTASDPTTCGLDGKCDGAGACRKHAAGTGCGAESCSDGPSVSSYTSARTCDGRGACMPATTSNCGAAYRCSGTKCRATCAGAQDCVPASYCSGTTCVAKKPDGQRCASAGECATGVCGGLCCAAGCTCTQPSAANLLKNPGIDKDTTSWTIDTGALSRSLSDAERCGFSGSLTTTIEANGQPRIVSQCIANTPFVGVYNFGARLRADSLTSGGQIICQILFHSGFNCDADVILANELNGLTTGNAWQAPTPESDPASTPVSGANSASFTCHLMTDPSNKTDFYLDMLYVARAPASY